MALRRRRGERAYEIAAASSGLSPGELLRRILDNERLLDLAVVVITVASETAFQGKIRALGRALATGALTADDAVIDQQRFLAGLLAGLEAPHIRVLEQLSVPGPEDIPLTTNGGLTSHHGWPPHILEQIVPGVAGLLDPILRTLEGLGLVRDIEGGHEYTESTWLGELMPWIEGYSATWTGHRCLELLEEAGQDAGHHEDAL